jgi:hypothetical protein
MEIIGCVAQSYIVEEFINVDAEDLDRILEDSSSKGNQQLNIVLDRFEEFLNNASSHNGDEGNGSLVSDG